MRIIPNTFAPEGAQRCRALTSGLEDQSVARKESLFESGRIYSANKCEVKEFGSMIRKSGYRFSEKIMLDQKPVPL